MVDFLLSRYAAIESEEGQGLAEYALHPGTHRHRGDRGLLFLGGEISSILSTIGEAI